MDDLLAVDQNRFNNTSDMDRRVAAVAEADRGALRSALRYLYATRGP